MPKSIKSGLKMPKFPKYEAKCGFRARVISRSAAERTSRSSFCFTGVKALLILENQIFLGHVHILFTRAFLSSPAAGLRLEIAHNIDKKKSELYFDFSSKKFLTKKPNRDVPQVTKICIAPFSDQTRAQQYFLCFNGLLVLSSRPKSSCRAL
ncbi:MAG TPA: hypothetical protein VKS98_02340 [Chthoniobacterales bacterium]|nr:hypothetical protein [Chthoniobacterales bacterium]